jgi:hypothetical protein
LLLAVSSFVVFRTLIDVLLTILAQAMSHGGDGFRSADLATQASVLRSGESIPQKGISKAGDRYLRTMMVQGAHYILGPFAEDSDLRRWGLKFAERGGKNAKKRAVVAVARKLAVLLHRLLVSGEVYEPLRNSEKAVRTVAQQVSIRNSRAQPPSPGDCD